MRTKNICRKKKASIVCAIMLAVASLLVTSTSLAHPPQPDGPFRVFQGNVNVSLSAIDNDSGVNYTIISIWYKVTSTAQWALLLPPTNYTGTILCSAQGWYQAHFYSVDNSGNIETEKYQTFFLWQDILPPYTQINLAGHEIFPSK